MARRSLGGNLGIVAIFMAASLTTQVIAEDSEGLPRDASASQEARNDEAEPSDREPDAKTSHKDDVSKLSDKAGEAERPSDTKDTEGSEDESKDEAKRSNDDFVTQDKEKLSATNGLKIKVGSETAVSELSAPERALPPEIERQATDTKSSPEKAAPNADADLLVDKAKRSNDGIVTQDKEKVTATKELKTEASDSKDTAGANGMTREQLEMANQEMKSLLATASASSAEKVQDNQRLSELIATHEKTIADLQAKLDAKARDEIAQSSAKANMIADLQRQAEEQTTKSKELADEVAKLQTDLHSCTTEAAEGKKELRKQVILVQNRSDELLRVEEERDKLSDEKKVLSETILKHLEEIAGLRSTVEKQDGEIKSLQDDVAEKTKEISKLKKERQDLRRKHLHLHDQHRKLEAMYADPSVQHFLTAKAVKVYNDPGIEGAANKTFIYVVPTLKERYEVGKKLLNETEAAVYVKLNAYVGTDTVEPWLPAISGSLVYGGVILPFLCTVCCLTRIVCKLRPLLLFCHLDFLLTSLCAGVFAAYSGKEPLAAFAHHDPAVYLFTQAVFAFVYCLYGLLLITAFCTSKSGTSEGCYRLIQMFGAIPVACIYYLNVWTPAMMDEMPRMDRLVAMMLGDGTAVSNFSWVPYVPVSVNFLVLLELERMCWNTGRTAKEKEADKMSIVMRDDVELASIIPNVGEDRVSDSKKA